MRISLICAIATLSRAVVAKPIAQPAPRAVETTPQQLEDLDLPSTVTPEVKHLIIGESETAAFTVREVEELYGRVFNRSKVLAPLTVALFDPFPDDADSTVVPTTDESIKTVSELLAAGLKLATQELSKEANGGGLWTPLTGLECDAIVEGLNKPLLVQWELFEVVSRNTGILEGAQFWEVLELLRHLIAITAPECRGALAEIAKVEEAECKSIAEFQGSSKSVKLPLESQPVRARDDIEGLPFRCNLN